MLDRFGEVMSLVLGTLALGYLVFEIDRRRRKLHEVFDVLDSDDAEITAMLEGMVASGELRRYAAGAPA